MKFSHLVPVACMLALTPWAAAESKAEEALPLGPLILASSWSHSCGANGSIVTVTLDSTTAGFYGSLTMTVDGNPQRIGTQSPSSTSNITRQYLVNAFLLPGQHTFSLSTGSSGSPTYTFSVVGYCKLPDQS